MARWTFYRLDPKPGAGFHFGQRGLEQEDSGQHCPSDTLFSGLVATLADLQGPGAVSRFTALFEEGQSPYLLTSAFPRAGNLPLLPMPRRRVDLTPRSGQRKLLKRLRYVSPAIFGSLLVGEPMDAFASEDGQGRFLQDGQVWQSAPAQPALPETWGRLPAGMLRKQRVWRAGAVDRVTID
jgi:CRISPR-associated protein Csm4